MIVSYDKEKAFNAITFFLEHTGMCYKKKLFKLLWLLDSEHFQETGRSVTGYVYQAWQMGPVPVKLDLAMKNNDPELTEYFDIGTSTKVHGKKSARSDSQRLATKRRSPKPPKVSKSPILLVSKRPFESKYFSKRQKDLLASLEERFNLSTGDEMQWWTHRPGTPWHQVWMVENRNKAVIPYDYTLSNLSPQDQEVIRNIARERESFLSSY